MEIPKKLSVHLPENLYLEELFENNPPDFEYEIDWFKYFIDFIYYMQSKHKDNELEYVPFYSPLMQRRNRQYNKYIKYLLENKVFIGRGYYWEGDILKGNGYYKVGQESKSYKFTYEYNTPCQMTFIENPKVIKKILKYIELPDDEQAYEKLIDYSVEDLEYLSKWFNEGLEIDYIGVYSYLDELREKEANHYLDKHKAMVKYNSRKRVVDKILRKDFYWNTVDDKAGRFHTVLTQLKGDLRQFVTYKGQKLVSVDIKNSQPYLSTILFNRDRFLKIALPALRKLNPQNFQSGNYIETQLLKFIEELPTKSDAILYRDLVISGGIYEHFGELIYYGNFLKQEEYLKDLRKIAKTKMFSAFFSPNGLKRFCKEIKLFSEHFPSIYQIFSLLKTTKHNALACLLQYIEAQIVLLKACKRIAIEKPFLPIFTLHDCIITIYGEEEYVRKVLEETLFGEVGFMPTLKIEKWENTALYNISEYLKKKKRKKRKKTTSS
jgi:hypothetical protein